MSKHVSLSSLPYDVRQLIYEQLFPSCRQLYLMASHKDLQIIKPLEDMPMSFLMVNRFFHEEASDYLYNKYLFNIVGITHHCLALYPDFECIMQKYARQPVRLDAFSNGDHSATCCISLQPGTKHLRALNRRRRGKPRSIEQLQSGQPSDQGAGLLLTALPRGRRLLRRGQRLLATTGIWVAAVLALLLAMCWAYT